MPIGIVVNGSATLIGALLGCTIGQRFPERLSKTLSCVFALVAITIGITMIMSVSQLSAVALSLILGAILGEALSLNRRVENLSGKLNSFFQNKYSSGGIDSASFINIIVMFSISGYGIFGALNEGFTGDHSALIVKSILDFFTIICFAATYGKIMICTFIPQFLIYIVLFFLASWFMPFVDPIVLGDLTACAGVITFATGVNLLFKKNIPTVSFLPALVIVILISKFWGLYF